MISFNPHTHEGCDWVLTAAPRHIRGFNPHTHEGCDFFPFSSVYDAPSFNPHTHEGCDRFLCAPMRRQSRFNPHTHEGCDMLMTSCGLRVSVSIHTPTKGVTFWVSVFVCDFLFQSTHPRRV